MMITCTKYNVLCTKMKGAKIKDMKMIDFRHDIFFNSDGVNSFNIMSALPFIFNLQPSTFDLQTSTFNFQRST